LARKVMPYQPSASRYRWRFAWRYHVEANPPPYQVPFPLLLCWPIINPAVTVALAVKASTPVPPCCSLWPSYCALMLVNRGPL
jgi:hypothetical protein